MNKLIFLSVGVCVLLASCKKNHFSDSSSDVKYVGDTVFVSEQSILTSKIKLQTVALEKFSKEFNTTGTVRAIAGQMAEIAPLFDGRITRSYVRLGQKVNVGAPLFEMHSAEFSETVKNYFLSLQTQKMKASNLQRQKDLVKNGVGAVKELEEAETDYEVAQKEYENAVANLKMLNLHPDEITMGQPLKIVSPIAGEVVQAHIVIGQYVKSDAEPLAVVAELSKIWVVAQVKEANVGSVSEDDKVEIRTEANPEQVITGQISHISELLDEETRSVQVLIACDNQDRKLKPGMFANVHFIGSPKDAIVVPSTAVLQNEDHAYVFVRKSEGMYVRRAVKSVTAGRQETLITDGLNPGDVIILEGGIYLMGN